MDTFVEMAFREMHSSKSIPETECHECKCKDKNAGKFDKLAYE